MALGKAVIAGVLQHVSPSQIATFSRCNRLWFFEKVCGLRQPETAAQGEGVIIHGQIEQYYKDGTLPEHEAAHKAVTELLPPYGSSQISSEFPHDYSLGIHASGIPLNGRIDLLDCELPVVWDVKTCKTFRYALSPKELAKSPQMLVYGRFVFDLLPNTEEVTLRHLYIHKTKPQVKLSECSYTLDKLLPVFNKYVVEPAAEMIECAKQKEPADVPGNFMSCHDFGGCHHYDRCHGGSLILTPQKPVTKDNMFDDLPTEPTDPTPMKTPEDDQTAELILFINCLPVKGVGEYGVLEDEIAKRTPALCKDFGVTDLREVDFGKGTAKLAASFVTAPISGTWVATTNGLSGYVVDSLIAVAGVVVKGVT